MISLRNIHNAIVSAYAINLIGPFLIKVNCNDVSCIIDRISFCEYNNANGYSDSRMLNCSTGEQDDDTFILILRVDYKIDKGGFHSVNGLKVDDPIFFGIRWIELEYSELEQ